MESKIENETTTDVAVNAPQSVTSPFTSSDVSQLAAFLSGIGGGPPVTLYAQDGEQIVVPEDKVATWLARGFSRTETDPAEIAEEIDALLPAVGPAWRAYLDAVVSGKVLDPAAQTTAHTALNELTSACNRLHLALHTRYEPAPQEETA